MGEVKKDNLDDVFDSHPPTDETKAKYLNVRESAKIFAKVLIDSTPRSKDQQVALQKLRECVMMANASIALDGRV